jgi:RNA polymerase sigma-70 factor (family 1)
MIEAIKRGDASAFEQAYVEHRERVYGYFLKKTKSPEDARDLLQSVFLRLWKYRRSLSEDYLLEQHLFNIARTVFIDHLRSENKKAHIKESAFQKYSANPGHAQVSTAFDLRAQVGSVLSAMPEIRKKVFELNRLEGYSYQEIARELSISVKSVDNNLSKALKQLRKMVVLAIIIIAQMY